MDGRQPRLLKELWTITQSDVSPLRHQALARNADIEAPARDGPRVGI